jgi:CDP-diacylglycerol--glycerol-3-phosphate 3-phosphatidyltransferase
VPVLNLPNVLTMVRLLLVPVFGWVLLSDPLVASARWWAAAVFGLALLTDFVDGQIARRFALVTNFGKLWDPLADKAITGMAWVGLSIIGELPWWVTIVVLVREWGITVLRFAIVKWGIMAANRGGKIKTMLQTWVLGLWIMPVHLYYAPQPITASAGSWWDYVPGWLFWLKVALMVITVIWTVVTGLDYLREARRLRDRYRACHPLAS